MSFLSVQVHLKFKLMTETLYLTVNLIDRYLSVQSVSRKNLQLVGVTALLLAAKYEEIWAPEVNDFVHISDNAYTREQILHMEKTMLNTLQFNLTVPTPYVFVARCLKAAAADREVFYLQIPCIMDCPLLDGDYMKLYKVSFETKLTIWQSF
jgi:cyclin B